MSAPKPRSHRPGSWELGRFTKVPLSALSIDRRYHPPRDPQWAIDRVPHYFTPLMDALQVSVRVDPTGKETLWVIDGERRIQLVSRLQSPPDVIIRRHYRMTLADEITYFLMLQAPKDGPPLDLTPAQDLLASLRDAALTPLLDGNGVPQTPMSIVEAAQVLQLPEATVSKLVKLGHLPRLYPVPPGYRADRIWLSPDRVDHYRATHPPVLLLVPHTPEPLS